MSAGPDAMFPLPNSSTDLSGQVVLVTGASSGLGRRFAAVLASAGASVAVAARRADRLEQLVDEIRDAGGYAAAFPLDISLRAAITPAVDAVEATLGPVSILVNNAGIGDATYTTDLTPERVDELLDTNVRGPFLLATEVARRLIKRGAPGRIVNVTSMAAHHHSGRGGALYSVTKAALTRMTETLAVEWARHHINVTAIAPGAFDSEMTAKSADHLRQFIESSPRRRIGDPAQLDSTLLFLVSPASEMVTGAVVKVDDGQTPR